MMGLGLSDQGSVSLVLQLNKQSHHAFFYFYLTLTLLMSEVVTDHHDATFATNNFALIANFFHAWLNLHELPSFFYFVKTIYITSNSSKNYL